MRGMQYFYFTFLSTVRILRDMRDQLVALAVACEQGAYRHGQPLFLRIVFFSGCRRSTSFDNPSQTFRVSNFEGTAAVSRIERDTNGLSTMCRRLSIVLFLDRLVETGVVCAYTYVSLLEKNNLLLSTPGLPSGEAMTLRFVRQNGGCTGQKLTRISANHEGESGNVHDFSVATAKLQRTYTTLLNIILHHWIQHDRLHSSERWFSSGLLRMHRFTENGSRLENALAVYTADRAQNILDT